MEVAHHHKWNSMLSNAHKRWFEHKNHYTYDFSPSEWRLCTPEPIHAIANENKRQRKNFPKRKNFPRKTRINSMSISSSFFCMKIFMFCKDFLISHQKLMQNDEMILGISIMCTYPLFYFSLVQIYNFKNFPCSCTYPTFSSNAPSSSDNTAWKYPRTNGKIRGSFMLRFPYQWLPLPLFPRPWMPASCIALSGVQKTEEKSWVVKRKFAASPVVLASVTADVLHLSVFPFEGIRWVTLDSVEYCTQGTFCNGYGEWTKNNIDDVKQVISKRESKSVVKSSIVAHFH